MGARTVSVGKCHSVASSSVETEMWHDAAIVFGRTDETRRDAGAENWPNAPAISRSFRSAASASSGRPVTLRRISRREQQPTELVGRGLHVFFTIMLDGRQSS